MLSPSGHTPRPDGWVPAPLVEDRSHFGLHCITSSPLILSFNITNETLVEMVWPIISNEEALAINRDWAGSPGRLVSTIRPSTPGAERAASGYVLRKGQVGKADGWGHDLQSARGLTCPFDVDQPAGVAPTCNLLWVMNATVAEAQQWCTANASCAAFSYKPSIRASDGRFGRSSSNEVITAYFKDATQLAFADSNFRAGGQVQSGWFTQTKVALTPPGDWRSAPCAGTVCPRNSPPCHEACFSIAPCCSDTGPAGETLDFADGEAQLWAKRLSDGSHAVLLVNLGTTPLTHTVSLDALGIRLNASGSEVAVRDVWRRASAGPPIPKGENLVFNEVGGHDSQLLLLTPQGLSRRRI